MRLLWIDDEIDLLRPFVYGLKEKGYQVDTATNGPDGLELARLKDYDLVLLDEIMTGMDGLETLRHIKEHDPNLLVAMVTKSGEEELLNEAYGKLADDFVVKPFTPVQLLAVLKRLLDKKSLVQDRIAQEYVAAWSELNPPDSLAQWMNRYRFHIRWTGLLRRYGDEALREVQEQRRLNDNAEFAEYVIDRYPGWLKSREGPVLSHRFFEKFVQPRLGNVPVYLVIFDSMRYDQWQALEPVLQEHFEVETQTYLSLLPSATPYARNALLSGLLPLEIVRTYPQFWVHDETGQNRFEKELLERHLERLRWPGRMQFAKTARNEEIDELRRSFLQRGAQLYVLIVNFLDLLIHSLKNQRMLDEIVTDEYTLIDLTRLWFTNSSVFELLKQLARQDCRVILTTDHGFVRVRHPTIIHGGREISQNLRYKHGGALRIEGKGALVLEAPETYMLPTEYSSERYAIAKSDHYFVYPTKPKEYERTYKFTYQHGGISMEEMILPVGTMRPRRS
jgi:DNA-binding response OmpR family regulator